MKAILLPALLISVSFSLAEPAEPKEPKKSSAGISPKSPKKEQPLPVKPGGTTMDVRAFLIGTKWSWRNVSAGVPDRECIFMADGTFRHPHFVAKFTVKDPHTVVLTKKGGKAVLTFDADYQSFEALDFNQVRITGGRL
jgi:hypothetical protein